MPRSLLPICLTLSLFLLPHVMSATAKPKVRPTAKAAVRPGARPADRPAAKVARLKEPPMVITARYLSLIHNQIQRHWGIAGVPLMELHRRSATLRLWIHPDGKLKRVRILLSSGLKTFDSSLTKAVAAALPLPKPGPALRAWVAQEGVEILFRKRVFKRKALPIKKAYKGSDVLYDWQKKKLPTDRRPAPRR